MVSVVVPVYNESAVVARALGHLRAHLATLGTPHEIVVVDDGSTDASPEVLGKTAGVRVIRHPENRGYGASLKTGIRAATGDIIGIVDADGSYPVERFSELLEALTDGVDMVVGVRQGPARAFPLLRRPGKAIVGALANFLAGKRIPDLNSGMRVMRRSLLEEFFHLFPDGFSFTTTLTLAVLTNRRGVKWVPIAFAPRVGHSSLTLRRGVFREFPNFLTLVVRIITYFRPLRFFGSLGLLFLFLGVANVVRTLVVERNVSDASILLVVVGIQIGLMGLIADLIVRSRS